MGIPMINQPDFKSFLACLAQQKVRYMIVGGRAVTHYGYPRFMRDLDVFCCTEKSNMKLLYRTLIKLGFKESETTSWGGGNINKTSCLHTSHSTKNHG